MKSVRAFREKPDRETAKDFLADGNYLWNSGIFIWSLKNIMASFEEHLPDMVDVFREGQDLIGTNQENDFIQANFSRCENISIDYGVLERAAHVSVVESEFGWSDLGTYGSLYTHLDKDVNGNTQVGAVPRYYESKDNLINVSEGKMVVTKGLEGFIVVETEKALMIVPRNDEQFVKQVVNDLKSAGASDFY